MLALSLLSCSLEMHEKSSSRQAKLIRLQSKGRK
nr:MAG TPA: hypothetical protein [Crassvirales sp.]